MPLEYESYWVGMGGIGKITHLIHLKRTEGESIGKRSDPYLMLFPMNNARAHNNAHTEKASAGVRERKKVVKIKTICNPILTG